jgi:hypothetical protein
MKKRKPSWEYLKLASRIQTGPRAHAAKLVLLFLADSANNEGQCWHGYRSISAHCNGLAPNAIREALLHLRDNLHIITWTPGSGGCFKKSTNTYQLDLGAMKNLVAAQGVFDSETGKLIYKDTAEEEQSMPLRQVESMPLTQVSVDASKASVDASKGSVDASKGIGQCLSDKHNPHGAPRKNPHKNNPGPAVPFSADVSISPIPQIVPQLRNAPPPAGTPHEGVISAQFRYGDPLPGAKWSDHRGAYIDAAGREISTKEVDVRIAAYETARKETSNARV